MLDVNFVVRVTREEDGNGFRFTLDAVEGPNDVGEDWYLFYGADGSEVAGRASGTDDEGGADALVDAITEHFPQDARGKRALLSQALGFLNDEWSASSRRAPGGVV